MKKLNIAVVGATGLVGRTMLQVLEQRDFPLETLKLAASERSIGMKVPFKDIEVTVEKLDRDFFKGVDVALFSAVGEMSKIWAPIAAEENCIVIDNSSAWRMEPGIPLIVPEVNFDSLKKEDRIIANPNCSTIQLVAALKPLQDKYGLKRVVCSTYQSISGAGQKGLDKLNYELMNSDTREEDNHPIAFNTMFHPASDNIGFTQEENKMLNEIRKIMDLPELKIAITCVRLPIIGGHAESVNLELASEFELSDVRELLSKTEGIIVMDDLEKEEYPTPSNVNGTDPVYVGRLRRDESVENGLYMWVVADNLRKGAATNAVQIAERIAKT